jgi:hypothetical protein
MDGVGFEGGGVGVHIYQTGRSLMRKRTKEIMGRSRWVYFEAGTCIELPNSVRQEAKRGVRFSGCERDNG